MKPIRILIADDHAVVRRGLVLVLRQEPEFVIAAEAGDGVEAVQRAEETRPDLVLLDWKMPRLDGLKAAGQIKQTSPTVRTLILSGAPVETSALDALDHGVDGFVHKDVSPAGLAHAIRVVAGGKSYLGPEITEALLARSRHPEPPGEPLAHPLSPRETEVLQWMATAATYREIGEQLHISEETVRTHVKRIFAKLGESSRTRAVVAALRWELINLD